MLEKPLLPESAIIRCALRAYGLNLAQVDFLPLGADSNTAVYKVVSRDSTPYFLKLRSGNFDEISLIIPRFLYDQGNQHVIPPQQTKEGQLWTRLDNYACVLYPFVVGNDGFEVALSDEQWIEFGSVLRDIHSSMLTPDLQGRIPSEQFSPYWRELVTSFQEQVEHHNYADPVAARLSEIMKAHRDDIHFLVERAGCLASNLCLHSPGRVLCHSDIHAGNLLLTPVGDLYIVDWDNPILAPKERDLMFIGAGVGGIWNDDREESLFYQGYGSADLNLSAIVYYRYERIVQDIAAYCQEIFLSEEGDADREQGLQYFASQFLPGNVLEKAMQTDQLLKQG